MINFAIITAILSVQQEQSKSMKRIILLPLALIAIVCLSTFSACKPDKSGDGQDSDSIVSDTLQLAIDSTMWGHLGEGTAMSVLEFITDKGDTLYLHRTSETTGEDAVVLGDIEVGANRYAILTNGASVDEGHSIKQCLNVSQMMGTWKNDNMQLTLSADGSAGCNTVKYSSWKVMNGKFILSGKTTTEYGETDRIDTMTIIDLWSESLQFITPQHDTITLKR